MSPAKQDEDPPVDPHAVTQTPAVITGTRRIAELRSGQTLSGGRFHIVRRVGSGGMGVVFEAFDHESDSSVALKVLPVLEPEALLRFKNEFRLLRDIRHPNLVRLRELFEEHGRWFFTMELVDGVDFLAHVRPGSYIDPVRLTAALHQLASGLETVHAAGRVHRDVKPSNILVTNEDRVVLLDFGVAAEVGPAERFTVTGQMVGTVAYMAPEQASDEPVSPAADWYAVGILLYEALTGNIPFRGSPAQILTKKLQSAPPSLPTEAAGASEVVELERLWHDLLQPDPTQRPSGREVLARLGSKLASRPHAMPVREAVAPFVPFVGRKVELEALDAMFGATRAGNGVTVLIHGESGAGKSALLARFADVLRQREPDMVVLAGRCYERESVPYRALDGAVDSLTQLMVRMPRRDAAVLVPANAALLCEVFPVLLRVEAFAAAPAPRHRVLDPQERRTRVFAALRELFFRLAERRPTLIAIDDLQWSDADSLALLREILRQPEAPSLLLAVTVRPPAPVFALPGDVREIRLGRLLPDEARELAAALLGDEAASVAGSIGEGAEGHPLFIHALARHVRMHGQAPGLALQLDDAIRTQVAAFEAPARRVVEVVAIAAAPITLVAASRAADVDMQELERLASSLAAANLVRTSGARSEDLIEPYHDRVREAVAARIEATARRDLHERLATALTETDAHSEVLAIHWRCAGDLPRAARYAVAAADDATRALAFERAVRLYRWALEVEPATPAERCELEAKLGDALANAGRGAEAAEAYLSASRTANAAGTDALEVFRLTRRAAEELLRSGRFDLGLETLRKILTEVGVKVARTLARALLSILGRRALVRLRGLGFVERDVRVIPAHQLARADACWAAVMGLALSDFIRGMDFQTRHLLLALRAGEPLRIVRALAFEACYTASYGVSTRRRTARLLEATRSLAARLDHPLAIAWLPFAQGVCAWLEGRFKTGLSASDEAERMLRDRCTGVTWELSAIQMFAHWCLWARGEYGELSQRVAHHLREAEERGDLFAVSTLRTGLPNAIWLAADEPARALEETQAATRAWSQQGFHLQHFWDLLSRGDISLYVRDGRVAYGELMGRWTALARSLLLRVQIDAVLSYSLRGRCALAAAAQSSGAERRRLLRDADRSARRLERERVAYSTALAGLLRAGAASLRGERLRAAKLYELADGALNAVDMSLHAAAARRRRGEILGGEQGGALVSAADEFARSRGITRPERMAAVLAPFPSAG